MSEKNNKDTLSNKNLMVKSKRKVSNQLAIIISTVVSILVLFALLVFIFNMNKQKVMANPLNVPENVRIENGNNENYYLCFNNVDYADYYAIYMFEGTDEVNKAIEDKFEESYPMAMVYDNRFEVTNYMNDIGEYYFSVQAIYEKDEKFNSVLTNPYDANVTKTEKLNSPDFARIEFVDNILRCSWTSVLNAVKYGVKYKLDIIYDKAGQSILDEPVIVAGNYYDFPSEITTRMNELFDYEFTISLQAISENPYVYASAVSRDKIVTQKEIEKPVLSNIEQEGDVYTLNWDRLDYAEGYNIYLNDELYGVVQGQNRTTYTFTVGELGNFKVCVQAYSNKPNIKNSERSDYQSFTRTGKTAEVIRLSTARVNNQIQVSWLSASDPTDYYVYLQRQIRENFADDNGNGYYDAGEPFDDINNNGVYDAAAYVDIEKPYYLKINNNSFEFDFGLDGFGIYRYKIGVQAKRQADYYTPSDISYIIVDFTNVTLETPTLQFNEAGNNLIYSPQDAQNIGPNNDEAGIPIDYYAPKMTDNNGFEINLYSGTEAISGNLIETINITKESAEISQYSYDLTEFLNEHGAGKYFATVKALKGHLIFKDSNIASTIINHTITLQAPKNVKITKATENRFDNILDCVGYYYRKVNSYVRIDEVDGNNFVLHDGTIIENVQRINDKYVVFSEVSSSTTLSDSNPLLSWTGVLNATKYYVYVNDSEVAIVNCENNSTFTVTSGYKVEVKDNTFVLSGLNNYFEDKEPKQYQITIMAANPDIQYDNSSLSEPISYNLIKSVQKPILTHSYQNKDEKSNEYYVYWEYEEAGEALYAEGQTFDVIVNGIKVLSSLNAEIFTDETNNIRYYRCELSEYVLPGENSIKIIANAINGYISSQSDTTVFDDDECYIYYIETSYKNKNVTINGRKDQNQNAIYSLTFDNEKYANLFNFVFYEMEKFDSISEELIGYYYLNSQNEYVLITQTSGLSLRLIDGYYQVYKPYFEMVRFANISNEMIGCYYLDNQNRYVLITDINELSLTQVEGYYEVYKPYVSKNIYVGPDVLKKTTVNLDEKYIRFNSTTKVAFQVLFNESLSLKNYDLTSRQNYVVPYITGIYDYVDLYHLENVYSFDYDESTKMLTFMYKTREIENIDSFAIYYKDVYHYIDLGNFKDYELVGEGQVIDGVSYSKFQLKLNIGEVGSFNLAVVPISASAISPEFKWQGPYRFYEVLNKTNVEINLENENIIASWDAVLNASVYHKTNNPISAYTVVVSFGEKTYERQLNVNYLNITSEFRDELYEKQTIKVKVRANAYHFEAVGDGKTFANEQDYYGYYKLYNGQYVLITADNFDELISFVGDKTEVYFAYYQQAEWSDEQTYEYVPTLSSPIILLNDDELTVKKVDYFNKDLNYEFYYYTDDDLEPILFYTESNTNYQNEKEFAIDLNSNLKISQELGAGKYYVFVVSYHEEWDIRSARSNELAYEIHEELLRLRFVVDEDDEQISYCQENGFNISFIDDNDFSKSNGYEIWFEKIISSSDVLDTHVYVVRENGGYKVQVDDGLIRVDDDSYTVLVDEETNIINVKYLAEGNTIFTIGASYNVYAKVTPKDYYIPKNATKVAINCYADAFDSPIIYVNQENQTWASTNNSQNVRVLLDKTQVDSSNKNISIIVNNLLNKDKQEFLLRLSDSKVSGNYYYFETFDDLGLFSNCGAYQIGVKYRKNVTHLESDYSYVYVYNNVTGQGIENAYLEEPSQEAINLSFTVNNNVLENYFDNSKLRYFKVVLTPVNSEGQKCDLSGEVTQDDFATICYLTEDNTSTIISKEIDINSVQGLLKNKVINNQYLLNSKENSGTQTTFRYFIPINYIYGFNGWSPLDYNYNIDISVCYTEVDNLDFKLNDVSKIYTVSETEVLGNIVNYLGYYYKNNDEFIKIKSENYNKSTHILTIGEQQIDLTEQKVYSLTGQVVYEGSADNYVGYYYKNNDEFIKIASINKIFEGGNLVGAKIYNSNDEFIAQIKVLGQQGDIDVLQDYKTHLFVLESEKASLSLSTSIQTLGLSYVNITEDGNVYWTKENNTSYYYMYYVWNTLTNEFYMYNSNGISPISGVVITPTYSNNIATISLDLTNATINSVRLLDINNESANWLSISNGNNFYIQDYNKNNVYGVLIYARKMGLMSSNVLHQNFVPNYSQEINNISLTAGKNGDVFEHKLAWEINRTPFTSLQTLEFYNTNSLTVGSNNFTPTSEIYWTDLLIGGQKYNISITTRNVLVSINGKYFELISSKTEKTALVAPIIIDEAVYVNFQSSLIENIETKDLEPKYELLIKKINDAQTYRVVITTQKTDDAQTLISSENSLVYFDVSVDDLTALTNDVYILDITKQIANLNLNLQNTNYVGVYVPSEEDLFSSEKLLTIGSTEQIDVYDDVNNLVTFKPSYHELSLFAKAEAVTDLSGDFSEETNKIIKFKSTQTNDCYFEVKIKDGKTNSASVIATKYCYVKNEITIAGVVEVSEDVDGFITLEIPEMEVEPAGDYYVCVTTIPYKNSSSLVKLIKSDESNLDIRNSRKLVIKTTIDDEAIKYLQVLLDKFIFGKENGEPIYNNAADEASALSYLNNNLFNTKQFETDVLDENNKFNEATYLTNWVANLSGESGIITATLDIIFKKYNGTSWEVVQVNGNNRNTIEQLIELTQRNDGTTLEYGQYKIYAVVKTYNDTFTGSYGYYIPSDETLILEQSIYNRYMIDQNIITPVIQNNVLVDLTLYLGIKDASAQYEVYCYDENDELVFQSGILETTVANETISVYDMFMQSVSESKITYGKYTFKVKRFATETDSTFIFNSDLDETDGVEYDFYLTPNFSSEQIIEVDADNYVTSAKLNIDLFNPCINSTLIYEVCETSKTDSTISQAERARNIKSKYTVYVKVTFEKVSNVWTPIYEIISDTNNMFSISNNKLVFDLEKFIYGTDDIVGEYTFVSSLTGLRQYDIAIEEYSEENVAIAGETFEAVDKTTTFVYTDVYATKLDKHDVLNNELDNLLTKTEFSSCNDLYISNVTLNTNPNSNNYGVLSWNFRDNGRLLQTESIIIRLFGPGDVLIFEYIDEITEDYSGGFVNLKDILLADNDDQVNYNEIKIYINIKESLWIAPKILTNEDILQTNGTVVSGNSIADESFVWTPFITQGSNIYNASWNSEDIIKFSINFNEFYGRDIRLSDYYPYFNVEIMRLNYNSYKQFVGQTDYSFDDLKQACEDVNQITINYEAYESFAQGLWQSEFSNFIFTLGNGNYVLNLKEFLSTFDDEDKFMLNGDLISGQYFVKISLMGANDIGYLNGSVYESKKRYLDAWKIENVEFVEDDIIVIKDKSTKTLADLIEAMQGISQTDKTNWAQNQNNVVKLTFKVKNIATRSPKDCGIKVMHYYGLTEGIGSLIDTKNIYSEDIEMTSELEGANYYYYITLNLTGYFDFDNMYGFHQFRVFINGVENEVKEGVSDVQPDALVSFIKMKTPVLTAVCEGENVAISYDNFSFNYFNGTQILNNPKIVITAQTDGESQTQIEKEIVLLPGLNEYAEKYVGSLWDAEFLNLIHDRDYTFVAYIDASVMSSAEIENNKINFWISSNNSSSVVLHTPLSGYIKDVTLNTNSSDSNYGLLSWRFLNNHTDNIDKINIEVNGLLIQTDIVNELYIGGAVNLKDILWADNSTLSNRNEIIISVIKKESSLLVPPTTNDKIFETDGVTVSGNSVGDYTFVWDTTILTGSNITLDSFVDEVDDAFQITFNSYYERDLALFEYENHPKFVLDVLRLDYNDYNNNIALFNGVNNILTIEQICSYNHIEYYRNPTKYSQQLWQSDLESFIFKLNSESQLYSFNLKTLFNIIDRANLTQNGNLYGQYFFSLSVEGASRIGYRNSEIAFGSYGNDIWEITNVVLNVDENDDDYGMLSWEFDANSWDIEKLNVEVFYIDEDYFEEIYSLDDFLALDEDKAKLVFTSPDYTLGGDLSLENGRLDLRNILSADIQSDYNYNFIRFVLTENESEEIISYIVPTITAGSHSFADSTFMWETGILQGSQASFENDNEDVDFSIKFNEYYAQDKRLSIYHPSFEIEVLRLQSRAYDTIILPELSANPTFDDIKTAMNNEGIGFYAEFDLNEIDFWFNLTSNEEDYTFNLLELFGSINSNLLFDGRLSGQYFIKLNLVGASDIGYNNGTVFETQARYLDYWEISDIEFITDAKNTVVVDNKAEANLGQVVLTFRENNKAAVWADAETKDVELSFVVYPIADLAPQTVIMAHYYSDSNDAVVNKDYITLNSSNYEISYNNAQNYYNVVVNLTDYFANNYLNLYGFHQFGVVVSGVDEYVNQTESDVQDDALINFARLNAPTVEVRNENGYYFDYSWQFDYISSIRGNPSIKIDEKNGLQTNSSNISVSSLSNTYTGSISTSFENNILYNFESYVDVSSMNINEMNFWLNSQKYEFIFGDFSFADFDMEVAPQSMIVNEADTSSILSSLDYYGLNLTLPLTNFSSVTNNVYYKDGANVLSQKAWQYYNMTAVNVDNQANFKYLILKLNNSSQDNFCLIYLDTVNEKVYYKLISSLTEFNYNGTNIYQFVFGTQISVSDLDVSFDGASVAISNIQQH